MYPHTQTYTPETTGTKRMEMAALQINKIPRVLTKERESQLLDGCDLQYPVSSLTVLVGKKS